MLQQFMGITGIIRDPYNKFIRQTENFFYEIYIVCLINNFDKAISGIYPEYLIIAFAEKIDHFHLRALSDLIITILTDQIAVILF